jgi:hypothetical protein
MTNFNEMADPSRMSAEDRTALSDANARALASVTIPDAVVGLTAAFHALVRSLIARQAVNPYHLLETLDRYKTQNLPDKYAANPGAVVVIDQLGGLIQGMVEVMERPSPQPSPEQTAGA